MSALDDLLALEEGFWRAHRAGQDEYVAAMTSVYRETSEGWKLVIHQQTPL